MFTHIGEGIEKLYPGATNPFNPKAEVQDEGNGQIITRWDMDKLGPMPALSVLEAAGKQAMKDAADAKTAKEVKKAAMHAIDPKKIADPALKAVVEYLQGKENPQ